MHKLLIPIYLSAALWAADTARAEWREFVLTAQVTAKLTAYCPCARCCGEHADGLTSTGAKADRPGAAVDPRAIPYGSIVLVPGAGYLRADDTGGAMRRSWREHGVVHIDLRMRSHQQALEWGVRWAWIAIYRPAVPAPEIKAASEPFERPVGYRRERAIRRE